MAKKFGKFLMVTAAVGAAAAGVWYCLRGKDNSSKALLDEDDDFDDFSEDLDEDTEERGYVTLKPEKVTETVKRAAEGAKDFAQNAFEGAKEVFQDAKETISAKVESARSTGTGDAVDSEEFFDDETQEGSGVSEALDEEPAEPQTEVFIDEENETDK